jgi:hypothetical protein
MSFLRWEQGNRTIGRNWLTSSYFRLLFFKCKSRGLPHYANLGSSKSLGALPVLKLTIREKFPVPPAEGGEEEPF